LNRADGGVDSAFSLEPAEMKALVVETERAWQSLGCVQYGATDKEKKSMAFRRTLYITQDLEEGASLNGENVRAIRPGYGLPPRYLELVMGRRVKGKIAKGTPLSWDILL